MKILKHIAYLYLINLTLFSFSAIANDQNCKSLLKVNEADSVSGCPFCEAYQSNIRDEAPKLFDNTLITYSKHHNFFLIVQRGGFLEGSILISSTNHNISRISDMNQNELEEFLEFYQKIESDLKDTFKINHLIAFENGTTGSDTIAEANIKDAKETCRPDGGSCLSHFHWHINPLETEENPSSKIFEVPKEAVKIESWSFFYKHMSENPKKLYTLIAYLGELYFVDRSIQKRRSEWIRLLISIHLKLEGLYPMKYSYSWRDQQNDDVSMKTLKRLKSKYQADTF